MTYHYEKQKVGISHLRKEPEVKKELVDSNVALPDDQVKNLIGFYMPESNVRWFFLPIFTKKLIFILKIKIFYLKWLIATKLVTKVFLIATIF